MLGRQKCEGPGHHPEANADHETSASSDSARDAAAAQTSKALSTVRAALALKGYELRDLAGGGWLICRWNMAREVRDMDAVEAFARQVGAA